MRLQPLVDGPLVVVTCVCFRALRFRYLREHVTHAQMYEQRETMYTLSHATSHTSSWTLPKTSQSRGRSLSSSAHGLPSRIMKFSLADRMRTWYPCADPVCSSVRGTCSCARSHPDISKFFILIFLSQWIFSLAHSAHFQPHQCTTVVSSA